MKKPADMSVLVITNLGNNRFHYDHHHSSDLGFSASSNFPISREELKERISRMIDECMPEET